MPLLNFQPWALRPSRFLLRTHVAEFTKLRSCLSDPTFRITHSCPLYTHSPFIKPPSRSYSSFNPTGKSELPKEPHSAPNSVSLALQNAKSDSNGLLSPVHIPSDPDGVLNADHPATSILSHSSVVVTRQLELMNVMLGFEQANRYTIMDPQGNHIGYMAERELGMGNMMARQMFSTHRNFTTHVFDRQGMEVLRFHRPFAWISSRMGVYDAVEIGQHSHSTLTPGSLSTEINPDSAQISPLAQSDMRIIGEAQQKWAPLRRKYNLFLYRKAQTAIKSQESPPPDQPLSNAQAMDLTLYDEDRDFSHFAYVDEPLLSFDFSLMSQDSKLVGSVNRNFTGFGREIFTDTGVYALRMDAAALNQEPEHIISKTGQQAQVIDTPPTAGMTLDQRAVMLATAVSVDFDYFSRKSGHGGLMSFMPIWFPGGGGGAAAGEAGAEAGMEGGAVEGTGSIGGEIARDGGARATEEGAAVGMGSMGGYEAMQNRRGSSDGAPARQNEDSPQFGQDQQPAGQVGENEDTWGYSDDPWGGNPGDDHGDGGGGGGGDGGGLDNFDFF